MGLVERIDLCVRVAGEKARESDEFITLSQLVNGTNITTASNGDILIDFGAEDGYKTFVITGDGVETDFNVNHAFDTWDVAHEMYFVASKRTFVGDFIRTDVDNATVSTAPYILGIGEEIVCIVWNNFITTSGTQTLSLVGSVLAISGGNDVTFTSANVNVDSSGFTGNLSTDITTVQEALVEIDALDLGVGGGGTAEISSYIFAKNVEVSRAELLDLHNTSKSIIPDVGTNKSIFVEDIAIKLAEGSSYTNSIGLVTDLGSILSVSLSGLTDTTIRLDVGWFNSGTGTFEYVTELNLVNSSTAITDDNTDPVSGSLFVTVLYKVYDTVLHEFIQNTELISVNATDVTVDATGFTGNLSTDIVTVQDALAEVDALDLGGGGGGELPASTHKQIFTTNDEDVVEATDIIQVDPNDAQIFFTELLAQTGFVEPVVVGDDGLVSNYAGMYFDDGDMYLPNLVSGTTLSILATDDGGLVSAHDVNTPATGEVELIALDESGVIKTPTTGDVLYIRAEDIHIPELAAPAGETRLLSIDEDGLVSAVANGLITYRAEIVLTDPEVLEEINDQDYDYELIAAPGANKFINVLSIADSFTSNGSYSLSDYFTVIMSGTGAIAVVRSWLSNANAYFMEAVLHPVDTPLNSPLLLRGGGGVMSSGTGDLKLKIFIYYTIEDIT